MTPTDSAAYRRLRRHGAHVRQGAGHAQRRVHPDVASFEQILGLKTVLMGFADSDAIHSPNEHYGLFNYFKASKRSSFR